MRTDGWCNGGPLPDIPATGEEAGDFAEPLPAVIMSTYGE
jgi:hypothetical protein